jgi:nucleoside-diphosphate-sugar epimerase
MGPRDFEPTLGFSMAPDAGRLFGEQRQGSGEMDREVGGAVVTGASGFVGARLVADFLRAGWRVYAVTSRPDKVASHQRLQVVGCSWSPSAFAAAVSQIHDATLWVHAAAHIDLQPSPSSALALYRANGLLTGSLAAHVASMDCGRLVYLSTVSVYGRGQRLAAEVEPAPDSDYGLSKLLGERLSQAILGGRCLVIRLAGVWGWEERSKLFINRCLRLAAARQGLTLSGTGAALRNYLWVGDLPRIVRLAHERGWHGVRVAGGPRALSIRAMAEAIAARAGATLTCTDEHEGGAEDMVAEVSPELETSDFLTALDFELRTTG